MPGSLVDLGNNKWELRVSLGYNINGKQIRKTKRIISKSKKAAEKELAKFYVEVTKNPVIKGDKISFGEFIEIWQQRHNQKLSNKTSYRNSELLKNRILPAFYSKQLEKITDMDIVKFIEELKKPHMRQDKRNLNTLSDGSIQMHYKLIRSILNKAVQWRYLVENPCRLIAKDDIPKANYRRLPIWQENDLKRFLATLEKISNSPRELKYKLMISLALITGARRGEFTALTWDCIDFVNARIYIEKASEAIANKPLAIKVPKTKSSIRWLNIDSYTVSLLKLQKQFQDEFLTKHHYSNPKQFIFLSRKVINQEVSQIYPSSLYIWLSKFCKKYDFPAITVHSFRHMAASYALAYGVPLTTVQHMLGHTDIKTTAIYLHELESKRKEAVQILSKQWNQFRNA
ncbi:site-specific integrase [Anaerosinus gibii]|uniref:Site-specific integrase n=1 Tax=Selenobaculum gibii TaxID=3054208 RepID=A0A9Y2AHE1_9FIRM|nr:site-specific integrase [Selenobaculum gbiensis]WIW69892.1 site-specific integrase [Selenobaculum gbiensis]